MPFDPEQFITTASERLLTDEELGQLSAYVEENRDVVVPDNNDHPLIKFLCSFMNKRTTEFFKKNLKHVSSRVGPSIVEIYDR